METSASSMVSRIERTLFVFGEISPTVSGQIIEELHRLDLVEGDINITLQSQGGDEVSGYAIYDAIVMCKNKVAITGIGEVSSMAAIILQAADWRRLTYNSTFLVHNGTTPIETDGEGHANQDAVIELAEKLKKDNQRYYNILCERSLQPEQTVKDWCFADEAFTAEEAVNVGFADEVLKSTKNKPKKGKKK